ncbi:MAG: AAA family ATPase [bacterium]
MYLKHWNLKEKPFENTPNPKYFYNSLQHEEAFARMMYVIKEDKGAGMITGLFGCGKTILARALHMELGQGIYKIGFIVNPRLDEVGILKMICRQLGTSDIPEQKADVLMVLEKMIKNNLQDGRKTLLIIDEAHTIEDPAVFEEIRMLLNFQENDRFMLNILLLGQQELKSKIENNKQLLQRIAIRYHLEGLSEEDTSSYINHRITIAGGSVEFSPSALRFIFEQSGGIPRRINQICDMCLFTGLSQKLTLVDAAIVKEAVESLEK